MENRYLYKAKRIDNGEWVDGFYVKGSDMYGKETHVIFETDAIFYSHGETDGFAEINPATICQCTGLKDKNGELIWENDIMCLTYGSHRKYGYVRYGEYNCSCCEGVYGWYFENEDIRHNDWYEVVGNTFDNPELLEEKNHAD